MTVHHSFLDPRLPTSEPIKGKTYRADGWAYIELMSGSVPLTWFDEMEAVAGEGNVEYIYRAHLKDGKSAIAMFLISPEAQERMVAFLLERKKTPPEERIVQ